MPSQKITFTQVMEEYDNIKPSNSEDYYNWRVLLNYINKNKSVLQTVYDEGGVKGVLETLWNAEDGELVLGYFCEAFLKSTLETCWNIKNN